MTMMMRLSRRLIALLAGAALLGCATGEPFDPPKADDIPPGPGLFSGKDGKFTPNRR